MYRKTTANKELDLTTILSDISKQGLDISLTKSNGPPIQIGNLIDASADAKAKAEYKIDLIKESAKGVTDNMLISMNSPPSNPNTKIYTYIYHPVPQYGGKTRRILRRK